VGKRAVGLMSPNMERAPALAQDHCLALLFKTTSTKKHEIFFVMFRGLLFTHETGAGALSIFGDIILPTRACPPFRLPISLEFSQALTSDV
jgi:hypothetical protein